jgi:hypothetical protein
MAERAGRAVSAAERREAMLAQIRSMPTTTELREARKAAQAKAVLEKALLQALQLRWLGVIHAVLSAIKVRAKLGRLKEHLQRTRAVKCLQRWSRARRLECSLHQLVRKLSIIKRFLAFCVWQKQLYRKFSAIHIITQSYRDQRAILIGAGAATLSQCARANGRSTGGVEAGARACRAA